MHYEKSKAIHGTFKEFKEHMVLKISTIKKPEKSNKSPSKSQILNRKVIAGL
jgi:hypothetical protein